MKIAYLDCFSGISGDMLLGALIDAGLPLEELRSALASIPLKGYSIDVSREERSHLSGTKFLVHVDKDKQTSRGLTEIGSLIDKSNLSQAVKGKSLGIFKSLALEEGKIHNCPPEKVHFHEIGAVDSIVDIVGSVFGIEYLGIGNIFCSSIPLGSGFVNSQHGRIPLPAPATLALLKGIPVYDSGLNFELITPTGAVLVKELSKDYGTIPSMVVETVGYGVGSRVLEDRPNLLRLVIGRDESRSNIDTVVIIESNVDDTNPEWLGFLMDRLFDAGALDVFFSPIQMKKNRPGTLIQVIGKPEKREYLMDLLFQESTTLGVRFRYSQRSTLERSLAEVDSPWGKIPLKKVVQRDGSTLFLPEYEACRKIAEEYDCPLKDVYYWIMSLNMKKA